MNQVFEAVAAMVVIIYAIVHAVFAVRRWLFRRNSISVDTARAHVGQDVSVCYTVKSGSSTMEGSVLNSDEIPMGMPSVETPTGFFTLIPADIRSHFEGDPVGLFIGRLIRVRGRVEAHGNALRITVSDPSQIAK